MDCMLEYVSHSSLVGNCHQYSLLRFGTFQKKIMRKVHAHRLEVYAYRLLISGYEKLKKHCSFCENIVGSFSFIPSMKWLLHIREFLLRT